MTELHPYLQLREFSYDDLIIKMKDKANFRPSDVDLTTYFSRNIKIKTPIISSPMDTVTEYAMAIALALEGGIGVIHYNLSAQRQLEEVIKVKRFESGFISDPCTISPNEPIEKHAEIRKNTGISTLIVTDDGTPHGRFLGVFDKVDYSLRKSEKFPRGMHAGKKVYDRMLPLETLIQSEDPRFVLIEWSKLREYSDPLEAANLMLEEKHSGFMVVVDDSEKVLYALTRVDLEKNESYPLATKDRNKRLRVAVAVETNLEKAIERIEATKKYVDAYVVDTSNANIDYLKPMMKELKSKYSDKDFVVGNGSTKEFVEYAIECGADGIKIGTGSGDACDTAEVTGAGRLQGSAVYECSQAAKEKGVPAIADGAIKLPGDITKALALGASSVMMGFMLAGCEESPGEWADGKQSKTYRGMGSMQAMLKGGDARYAVSGNVEKVAEGVVKKVRYRGKVSEFVPKLRQAVKQGMQKVGCRTIEELHNKAYLLPDNPNKRRKSIEDLGDW